MDYNTFKETLEKELLEKMKDQNGTMRYARVHKDGAVKDALTFVPEGRSAGVTLYAQDVYETFQEVTDMKIVLEELVESLIEKAKNMPDESFLKNFLDPDNIVPVLLPVRGNEALLETIPHVPFGSLQVIFRFQKGRYSANLTYNYMEKMGWSEKELMDIALNSPQFTKHAFFAPTEYIAYGTPEGYSIEDEELLKKCSIPQIAVTNSERFYGAAMILNKEVMAHLAEIFQEDLYILPSSVHECMIMPKSSRTLAELREMVHYINQHHVVPIDWLSDDVYYYERDTQIIHLVAE